MEVRIIRLYPMFAIGGVLGLIQMAGQIAAHTPRAPGGNGCARGYRDECSHPAGLPFGLRAVSGQCPGMDPVLRTGRQCLIRDGAFPHAVVLLAVYLHSLAGALSLWSLVHNGNGDVGWNWPTIGFGALRVGYAFPLGILLARAFGATARHRTSFALLPVGGLAVLFAIDLPDRFDWIYNAAALFAVLPAILWFGARFALPKRLEKFGAVLGMSPIRCSRSTSLCCASFYVLARRLYLPGTIVAMIFVAGCFWLSWFLFHHVDVPVTALAGCQIEASRHPHTGDNI